MIFITGCATEIPIRVADRLTFKCERHAGLKTVNVISALGTKTGWGYEAVCNDGAVFFYSSARK